MQDRIGCKQRAIYAVFLTTLKTHVCRNNQFHLLRVIKHLTAKWASHQDLNDKSATQNQYISLVQEPETIEALKVFFCFRKDHKTSCLQLPVQKTLILLLIRLFIESVFSCFHLPQSLNVFEHERRARLAEFFFIDTTLMNVARPQELFSLMLLPIYGILDRKWTVIMQKQPDIHNSPRHESFPSSLGDID